MKARYGLVQAGARQTMGQRIRILAHNALEATHVAIASSNEITELYVRTCSVAYDMIYALKQSRRKRTPIIDSPAALGQCRISAVPGPMSSR